MMALANFISAVSVIVSVIASFIVFVNVIVIGDRVRKRENFSIVLPTCFQHSSALQQVCVWLI